MQEVITKNLDSTQHKRAKLLAQFKKIQVTADPIQKRDTPAYAPLSCAQEPLWLMSQLEPDNPIYNVAGALEFDGALNTEALQQSLNEVIRRHEILHSCFRNEQGSVVQRVTDYTPICLQRLDLTRFGEEHAINYFQQFADDYIRAPFELSSSLPLRGLLVQLSKHKQILLLTLHHIVADRWSVSILMEEVASLYYHFGSGTSSLLPELDIHYGDFAAWQRQQTGANGQHLSYWQQKLQNLSSQLTLPLDRPRLEVSSYKGDLYRFELSHALTEAIKHLAKQHNASLFMLMASALNILLHRYSGSQDIAIGYTAAGRQQTQTAKLIGFFVNTLVLRTQLEGEESFVDVLKRIREQTLNDQDHQDVSYGQLVEAVSSATNAKRTPLFQVMLTVQNAPAVEFQLPGLTVQPITLENRVSQFDLTFLIEEQNGKLQIVIEYSTDLFDVATLARLAGHFTTLLDGIVKHPNMPLSRLPLLTESEWQQTVIDWNLPATPKTLNQPMSAVPQWIEEQALATPDNTAVVFASTQLSYRELNDRANRLAHHLLALGVAPESRIGVSAERSVELIIALLAVLKAGAAYVPLDPTYPQDRLNYIIKDASIKILLTQSALFGQFRYSDCTIVDIDDRYAGHSNESPVLSASLDNTAYIIYTSGSTGQPKGVLVSHRNLRHSTLARFDYYQGSPDCFLLLSSFGFDSSVAGIFWTLSRGGCLCLPQQDEINNPAALAALIARHQVSHTLALPTFYAAIISHSDIPSLRSLAAVIVAGEACSNEVANEHHRKLPNVKLYNEYGPTEATVWSSVYQSVGTEILPTLPIGRVINDVQLYILDRHHQPVPIGVAGELCISGQGITQGYVQRPDLTAEKFIPDPFDSAGNRLYKTGDLARFLANGNIEFLGRIDHQVKIRGYRIELGEIEARLATFATIQDAVVIAREDNSGDKRLVAYLQAPQTIAIHELRNHLASMLPEYMVPSAFVTLDAFPLTPNGKLDRRALPAPDLTAVATQHYDAPQDPAEIALAELWQELLEVERVGRNDHFFELGGHSLMAISLVEQLQQRGYSADVMNVFTMPILAEMAATLEDSNHHPAGFDTPANLIPVGSLAITPDMLPLIKLTQNEINSITAHVPEGVANIQDIYPLSALQEGILFHHLLDESHDAYLKRSIVSFDNRQLLDSFLDALQSVINRHDILRTAVHWQGLSQPVQVVQRKALLDVIELDLSATDDVLPELLRQTDLSQMHPDLQRAPLFVAYVAADPNIGKWLLALINHHLIDDNYTLQLILSEIKLIQQGQGDKLLPPLPYRNFIAQGNRGSLAEHEKYFREQLADINEPTAPFGIMDIQGDGRNVTEAKLALSDEVSQHIYESARQHGVTAAVLFHVAWARVLGQLCGRDEVVFGTVLSGRLQGSTSTAQALGVFINTLPIHISLGNRAVQQVVNDSYQRLGALLDHEHASLALAQRCSSVATSMPLFTTLLNYRHSNLITNNTADLFAKEGIAVLRTEERTNYPITISVDDLGQSFSLSAQCMDGIDPERMTAYLATTITQLVDALSQTPQFPMSRLSILSEQERRQIMFDFNAAEQAYPEHICIHQLFEQQVEQTPDAIALIYEDQSLSYDQLNRQANRLAHRLLAQGISPDDRVALCVERSLEMVIGLLGILKAGGAYIPLDPSYPEERLTYMLADAAPVAILTQSEIQTRLPKLYQKGVPIIVIDAPDNHVLEEQHLSIGLDSNPHPAALGLTSQHLAYIIYTSGSTGQPKGTLVNHSNIMRLFSATEAQFHFNADDVWTLFHSYAFDFSVWELWGALLYGGRLVIVPYATSRNPDAFYRLLCREGVTVLNQTPSAFRQLSSAHALNPNDHKLRILIFGGEALDSNTLESWFAHNGPACAQPELFNGYGPTETSVFATFYRCYSNHTGVFPIGYPIANTQMYILDTHLQPVPLGVTGELYIGGAGIARGYLGRPELTAERFIDNPFKQSAHAQASPRLYKTGDLGCWLPDGSIEYLGRNDFQVKIRGFRIELGEIEAQLCRCSGVREAVVIANEDVSGDKRLVAYLLADAGQELSAADLRNQLSASLADYMLPSAFVTLDAFPLTPNGKLDRNALPAPDSSAVITRPYQATQGETETLIADIWKELLHLDRVGRYDQFFELGGHSLLAVQLVARVRQTLGVELALRELFAYPVLADLVQAVNKAQRSELPIIMPADRSQPLPLSWAQQRLWFLAQFDAAASQAYHIPAGLRLHGQLDKFALINSLNLIVARHEVLRTTFVCVDGEPRQIIASSDCEFTLLEHDLRGLVSEAQSQTQTLTQICQDEVNQPFDLAAGPLIRGRLLQLTDDEYVLLITQHHIISDGWSIGRLVDEFSTLYTAFSQGQAVPLSPLILQYVDYAVWQRQWLQGEVLQAQIDFWKDQLAGAPELLKLPTDFPRPAQQSYAGANVDFTLSTELSTGLKQLSQRHNVTLFMTLLTAWSVLMTRLSGQNDVVIGTPVANRAHADLENLIGFFVNTLALRIRLDQETSTAQLLEQVKATTLAAYTHQDLPFEQLVEAVKPTRSMSHSPLFQVMLALNNTPTSGKLSLPGLTLSTQALEQSTTQFDLSLSVTDLGDVIVGNLHYASDLFTAGTITRLVGYFQTLLTGMLQDDQQAVSRLPLLSTVETRQLLVDFNATETEFPQHLCIHQLFEQQVEQTPDAIALVYEDQSLSYDQLNRRANQLAHHLITLGIRPDDRVAICVERSLEMVIGLLGILKAGGAYVPLDPSYPEERLAFMLNDCAPVALLTQQALLAESVLFTERLQVPLILLDALDGQADTDAFEHNLDPLTLGLTSQHLAYVIYTSGSTGQPKGVMIQHSGLCNLAQTQVNLFGVAQNSRVLQFASFSFDASIWEIVTALCHGARLCLASKEALLPGEALTKKILDYGITHLLLPSSVVTTFPETLLAEGLILIVGGDVCPPELANNWSKKFRFFNAYGPTEATVFVTTYRCLSRISNTVPIGYPLANTQIYILDAHLQPVPLGVTGELYIGGAGVARGYLNRPELTAERFIDNPFRQIRHDLSGEGTDAADSQFAGSSSPRLYKTGDLGRWLPDGSIEYLGRNDFQVKIRGFRIELGEIEAQLSRCPGVREAVVVARKDVQGDKRLVAYLIAETEQELSVAELRSQLASSLADYMLPSAFVTLDAFPLTPNGKLDRKALPAPDGSAVITRPYEAPQGETETLIADIWKELLHLDQVGRYDQFFELGGHSLLVVTLIERMRQQGLTATVRTVFTAPVLADMAAVLDGQNSSVPTIIVPPNFIPDHCTAITPELLPLINLSQAEIDGLVIAVPGGVGNIQDIYPLAPLQEGILFHHLLETQGDAYLLRTVLSFDNRNRLDGFLSALQRVIDRHDILRTAIHWQGLPQPVQVVQRQASLPIIELELAGDTQETIYDQLLKQTDPRQMRLNLQQAPLFAAYIAFDPQANEWLLSLLNHHLVCEHVTLEFIIAEIQQILAGQLASLPAPLPYRNFIAQALSVSPAEHEAYFRERLGDIDAPTAPFDILDVQGDGSRIREATAPLSADLAQHIRSSAKQHGVTTAVLFHLAWAQVLAQCTGRDDVVFGTVLMGRLQGSNDADRVLGLFINTLPIRISLGERSVRQLVDETYRNLSDLLNHEQASLALAQRCSAVEAPMPLFTTLFNYRHSGTQAKPILEDGAALIDQPLVQLVWEGVKVHHGEERTNYPITLSVDDLGQGFSLTAQCVGGINPQRMAAYLETAISQLVDALSQHPELSISRLSILPTSERQQVVNDFNANVAEFPQHLCIHQLFEQQVERSPETIALVYEDRSLTYDQLNRRANRLAHHLISLGVRPDDRVAICVERSLEMVIGLLGILKAGGAYVPLDPSYPEERLTFMLADCAPLALLTQSVLSVASSLFDERLSIPVILLDALDDQALDSSAPNRFEHNPDSTALDLTSQHLAYIIYTSGSTGQPKGTLVNHSNVVRLFVATEAQFHFNADDVWTLFHSFAFDFSVWELWGALIYGGRLIVVSYATSRNPETFYRLLCQERVTVLNQTPSAFRQLCPSHALNPNGHQLRALIFGGEALEAHTLDAWLTHNGPGCAQPSLFNGYGPTETTVFASFYCCHTLSARVFPIGYPIANTQMYILNDRRQPVPLGVTGEIYIGGAGVTRGYLNRPALTAERFIDNPFQSLVNGQTSARLYKTGDLGRWLPNGSIEYLGRNDFQVKIRGFRIELGEIEAQLSRCIGVREAVVIAREDSPDDKRLVAYLLADGGLELSAADLRSQLSATLADYMLPSAFVTLDSFPLTPNGKLDRKALPAPDGSAVISRPFEAPQGETEIAIADIWKELLHLDQVGRYDHFFELGGHSLLAVQLVVRIRDKLQTEAPLTAVFENPTLVALAEHLIDLQLALYSASDIALIEEQLNTLSETELHALLSEDSI